jgi:hypothetical protein
MKLIFVHRMPEPEINCHGSARDVNRLQTLLNQLTVDLVGSVFEFHSQSLVELREKIWPEVFAQTGCWKRTYHAHAAEGEFSPALDFSA